MIVTRELRDVVKMGLRDIKFDIGPFITLIDGPSFEFQWQERPKLLQGQIEGADRVAISRTDMIATKEVEHIRGILSVQNTDILLLSRQTSSVVDELAKQILSKDKKD
jgi:G3E family GTPase